MIRCPECATEAPAGSRFCPACAAELKHLDDTRTSAPAGNYTSAVRATTPVSSPMLQSNSFDDCRFLPGTVLAERYRIVGEIGRGGMGEVYRADDIKLGQTVALKFLPGGLERDPSRLTRFFNEVKMARQVTHPNVCRVYDTGDFEGQHFLSMEYVDGEDLRSLLRRIGRLPKEKAVQIARQLCAGLAAAHEQGILHRDLKPANVMVDGRGRVRITDFGLAGLAESFQGEEIRAGTPTYMAPEQLDGKQVSTRSDIYSLGLVLYELFTGKPAFQANSRDELRQMHETSPTTPSAFVEGFDASIERVILRCLEKEPQHRPASVLSVSAALPGGDPLAEALAAGETPSPEMIAEAGGEGGLKPGLALACLIVILLGIVGALFIGHNRELYPRLTLDKPPDALEVAAREILATAGHAIPRADSARGFVGRGDYFDWVTTNDSSPGRWDELDDVRPAPLEFWYRESPDKMVPTNLFETEVSRAEPPVTTPGMANVTLDTGGRLVHLQIVPADHDAAQEPWSEPDWTPLLERAGLDAATLEPARSEWSAPVDCDLRIAWVGAYPDRPGVPIRIEAGARRGSPVFFAIVPPWTKPYEPESQQFGEALSTSLLITILFGVLISAVLLARRNLRLGRGDRRGAFRVACFVFASFVVGWIVGGDHVASFAEAGLVLDRIAWGLFYAGFVWVVYIALEPHARRLWPDLLFSWTRLLTGRYRDPLVGRSILAGGVCFVGLALVQYLEATILAWMGMPPDSPSYNAGGLAIIVGARQAAGRFLISLHSPVLFSIGVLFVLLLFRVLLRRQWAAVVALALIFSLPSLASETNVAFQFVLNLLVWLGVGFVLTRFGLLSLVAWLEFTIITDFPIASDFSVWYAGRTLIVVLIFVALTCYGFWIALAGRSLFARDFLPDQLEAPR